MSQYIISKEAITDLEEITDYLAMYSIDTADRLIEEFNNKCRYLTKFPSMGKGYPDLLPYLRGVPFQKYIVFYRIINHGIEIMRIIKGDRDLEAVFSDE